VKLPRGIFQPPSRPAAALAALACRLALALAIPSSECRPARVDTERYGRGAIAFHWMVAALVVGVGTLGLLHDSWPKRTQAFWINIHALCGLLLWMLVMARFWWRMRHAPPKLPVARR
jgi:hypothetical protein